MQCNTNVLEQQREQSDALTIIFIIAFLITTYLFSLLEKY